MDFQDMCSCAMDRALGIERASFSTVIQLNSSALDLYRNSLWLAPGFGDLLGLAAKAFALCIDLQTSWFHLMLPYATPAPEAVLNCATPGSAVESGASTRKSTANSIKRGA